MPLAQVTQEKVTALDAPQQSASGVQVLNDHNILPHAQPRLSRWKGNQTAQWATSP